MGKMILIVPWHDGRRGEPHQAWLLDWSPNGVGFVDPQALKPGDQFGVSVNLGQKKMALYTVRYSATLEEGTHKIGAELCGFVTPPEEDDDYWVRHLLRR